MLGYMKSMEGQHQPKQAPVFPGTAEVGLYKLPAPSCNCPDPHELQQEVSTTKKELQQTMLTITILRNAYDNLSQEYMKLERAGIRKEEQMTKLQIQMKSYYKYQFNSIQNMRDSFAIQMKQKDEISRLQETIKLMNLQTAQTHETHELIPKFTPQPSFKPDLSVFEPDLSVFEPDLSVFEPEPASPLTKGPLYLRDPSVPPPPNKAPPPPPPPPPQKKKEVKSMNIREFLESFCVCNSFDEICVMADKIGVPPPSVEPMAKHITFMGFRMECKGKTEKNNKRNWAKRFIKKYGEELVGNIIANENA